MSESSVVVERDVPAEMRDGTTLRADVYRPADEGEYPVLLQRTPYGKGNLKITSGLVFSALDAVERGYAVVVQDTRGRSASEGTFRPYLDDVDDGYDTVAWAAEQPWSNGRVGAYGSSYQGMTTLLAAVAGHDALEAIAPMLTGAGLIASLYRDGAFHLGERLRWTLFMITTAEDLAERPELEADLKHVDDVCWHLPVDDIPAIEAVEDAAFFRDWLTFPPEDGYGDDVDVVSRVDDIEVPVLHVTGWYDFLLPGFLSLYEAIDARGHPTARDHQYLVVGPWDHDAYLGNTPRMVGDDAFGPDGLSGPATFGPLAFDWFDHWLRDMGSLEDVPRVRSFQLGEDRWTEPESWPPAHEPTRCFLGSGGGANTRFGDGVLARAPVDGADRDSYDYDPRDPVPTLGGHVYMPQIVDGGVQDQRAIEEREDVLVYTGPRLTEPVAVAGPVEVTLHASSSAPDTDFTAKLVDVRPDGYAAILTEGIVRARFRDSTDRADFIEPGEVYEYAIDLLSTAHTFRAGHRIRLEVSSSNFPKFDRNPNARVPPSRATPDDLTVAVQQVLHDEAHPSHVTLPVVADR